MTSCGYDCTGSTRNAADMEDAARQPTTKWLKRRSWARERRPIRRARKGKKRKEVPPGMERAHRVCRGQIDLALSRGDFEVVNTCLGDLRGYMADHPRDWVVKPDSSSSVERCCVKYLVIPTSHVSVRVTTNAAEGGGSVTRDLGVLLPGKPFHFKIKFDAPRSNHYWMNFVVLNESDCDVSVSISSLVSRDVLVRPCARPKPKDFNVFEALLFDAELKEFQLEKLAVLRDWERHLATQEPEYLEEKKKPSLFSPPSLEVEVGKDTVITPGLCEGCTKEVLNLIGSEEIDLTGSSMVVEVVLCPTCPAWNDAPPFLPSVSNLTEHKERDDTLMKINEMNARTERQERLFGREVAEFGEECHHSDTDFDKWHSESD